MPARKLPPQAWIAARRDEGKTWDQIAELAKQEWGVEATSTAYNVAYLRGGGERVQPRYTEELPWRILVEHTSAYDATMLRFAARRKHGNDLNPREAGMLDRWIARLNEEDAVIHYDQDHGFLWVRRRPGVDKWLIHEPKKNERQGTVLDPVPHKS